MTSSSSEVGLVSRRRWPAVELLIVVPLVTAATAADCCHVPRLCSGIGSIADPSAWSKHDTVEEL
jgi:hypothetical protein